MLDEQTETRVSSAVIQTLRDMVAVDSGRGTSFVKLGDGFIRVVIQIEFNDASQPAQP